MQQLKATKSRYWPPRGHHAEALLAPASGFGEVAAQPMKTPKKFVNCTAFGAGGHTVLSVAG
jgi:hypothetical protein